MSGAHGSYDVNITSGISMRDVIEELERLGGPPGFKVIGTLEATLKAAFEDTQALTHIITGSLKASGKTESDYDDDVWTGTITYGGELLGAPAPGPPKDPVMYAIYEMARGGDHDFFRHLHEYDEAYEQAVALHFEG